MSVAYFDTSALVKGYIAELGSDWTRTLLENQDPNVFTSLMTVIEAACTFARRQREGLLSSDDHHQLLIVLDYDFAYRYNVLGVEPVVIDRASIRSTASPPTRCRVPASSSFSHVAAWMSGGISAVTPAARANAWRSCSARWQRPIRMNTCAGKMPKH